MLHIAISGIIGVGKTTLAKSLGEALDLPVYYEPVAGDSELGEFYQDMKSNAFSLQIHLLNTRFLQHQQLSWSNKGGIQDRSIYEDPIFAKMLTDQGMIRSKDYTIYLDLFNNMSKLMSKPNVIIHLNVTPEESLRRIKERARSYEEGITLEYLTTLCEYYTKFIEDISSTVRVIRIEWDEFKDPVKVSQSIANILTSTKLISEI